MWTELLLEPFAALARARPAESFALCLGKRNEPIPQGPVSTHNIDELTPMESHSCAGQRAKPNGMTSFHKNPGGRGRSNFVFALFFLELPFLQMPSRAELSLGLFHSDTFQHKLFSPNSISKDTVMPIPQELLDILVCPLCKTPVKFTPDRAGLKCQTCRRVYPVRDDIPVMLIEEATIAPE